MEKMEKSKRMEKMEKREEMQKTERMINKIRNSGVLPKFVIICMFLGILIVSFFEDANQTKARLMKEYRLGATAIAEGNYQEGIDVLKKLGDYKNSLVYIDFAQSVIEYETNKDFNSEDEFSKYINELGEMKGTLEDITEDSELIEKFMKLVNNLESQVKDCQKKEELYSVANDSLNEYLNIKDDSEISENEKISKYEKALLDLEKVGSYKDCIEMIHELKYDEAFRCYSTEEYMRALSLFRELGNYKDSKELGLECNAILKRLKLSNTITAGIRYSAAITEGGGVVFSGNGFHEESDIDIWDDIVSVSVKGHILMGLRRNGTVVTAGRLPDSANEDNDVYRIDTSDWKNIIEVASGQMYIIGLREDGTLTAQGHNGDGQVDIDDWHDIVEVACGWRHTVGLDSSNNIYITGFGSSRQLKEIAQNKEEWEKKIVAISAGGTRNSSHTVGLREDGTVVAVGSNNNGQCNVNGDEWTDIIAISAGADHTVGLRRNGQVVTTCEEDREALEAWKDKDIVAIAAGYRFTLGLQRDGKVIGLGYSTDGQRETEGWENIAMYIEAWDSKF